jgi:hypothetical protein
VNQVNQVNHVQEERAKLKERTAAYEKDAKPTISEDSPVPQHSPMRENLVNSMRSDL